MPFAVNRNEAPAAIHSHRILPVLKSNETKYRVLIVRQRRLHQAIDPLLKLPKITRKISSASWELMRMPGFTNGMPAALVCP